MFWGPCSTSSFEKLKPFFFLNELPAVGNSSSSTSVLLCAEVYESMRCTCVVACLLAVPVAEAFCVHAPTTLPRGDVALSTSFRSSVPAPRTTLRKNLAGPSKSGLDVWASRMSVSMTPAPEQDGRAMRISTLLSASAIVADGAGVGGKLAGEGEGSGGGDLVAADAGENKLLRAYIKGARYFTNLFPVWLTIFSCVALKDPTKFAWFTTE